MDQQLIQNSFLFGNNSQNLFNGILQLELFKKLHTGNVWRDLFIFMSISQINKLNNFTEIITKIRAILFGINNFIYKSVFRKKYKMIHVSYITENNDINCLYEPLRWYVNDKNKFKDVNLFNLEITESNPNPLKVTQGSGVFIFKNTPISYELQKRVVEIFAQREYKRQNWIISIKAFVNKDSEILEEICSDAKKQYDLYKKEIQRKNQIYRNNKEYKWEASSMTYRRNPETVILKNDDKELLIKDIDQFLNSEEFYISRDIPYTRHYLFHGLPGTGKSSMIRALATYTKRSIHYLMLNTIKSDDDMFKLCKDISYKDTIIVIEDIDCAIDLIVEDRDNKDEKDEKKDGITLSGLLNLLDGGIIDCHGRIVIMTTNHIDKLDKALIRPGRMDKHLYFGSCNIKQIEKIYVNFFGNENYTSIDEIKDITCVPADIVKICIENKDNPHICWRKIYDFLIK